MVSLSNHAFADLFNRLLLARTMGSLEVLIWEIKMPATNTGNYAAAEHHQATDATICEFR